MSVISSLSPFKFITPGRLGVVEPSNLKVQCPSSLSVLFAVEPTQVISYSKLPILIVSPTTTFSFNTDFFCVVQIFLPNLQECFH